MKYLSSAVFILVLSTLNIFCTRKFAAAYISSSFTAATGWKRNNKNYKDRNRYGKWHCSSSSTNNCQEESMPSEQSLSNEEISRYSRHLVLSVSIDLWVVLRFAIIGKTLRRTTNKITNNFDVFSQKGCWHGGPKTSEEFIRISDW